MKADNKNPLYRKVNTRARGVHHLHGDDYKNTRNQETATGMRQGLQRGLDYTPLFKFLLSKVGNSWNDIHSEAVSRLDKEEPVFWLVSKNFESANETVRIGESSYFSGLYIDTTGALRIKNPAITAKTLEPLCKCCTHTFNGLPFTKKYSEK